MCMGRKPDVKVKVPKPDPLPPAPPPPLPPKPPTPPTLLQRSGQVPDIRIGAAKRQASSSPRRVGQQGPGKKSLSIGSNQGLNL